MCRQFLLSRRGAFVPALALAGAAMLPGRGIAAGEEAREVFMRRVAGQPGVWVTLDACSGAFDMRIARHLVERRIPASVFVTGLWLRQNPAGLDFLLANRDVFGIENHGALHVPPVLGPRPIFGIAPAGDLDAVRREVARGGEAVTQATGTAPRWYRGATGFYSAAALDEIRRMGFAVAGYSFSADAGASLPASGVAARVRAARDGDVLIAHVNHPERPSGAGLVAGLDELAEKGVRFARLDGLGEADFAYR